MKLALFAEVAFLGDLVGYGADPEAVLEIVEGYARGGAAVVRGNHDEAAVDEEKSIDMNAAAAATLVDYARANGVDHIVTGSAPPGLPLATVWGTFATKLVGEAPCTVTLIRPSAAQAVSAPAAAPSPAAGASDDAPPR